MQTRRHMMTVVMMVVVMSLAAGAAQAATLTIGSAAPTEDGLDIANLAPGTGSTKLYTDTDAIGQLFTTGSDDVLLDRITLQSAAPSSAVKHYTLTIGEVSGTSYSAIRTESGIVQNDDSVDDDYWTFTLDTPVSLSATTNYGFDLAMTYSSLGWQSGGIPYRASTGNNPDMYPDGRQFSSQAHAASTPVIDLHNGDLVFHLNMAPAGGAVPEPMTMCALGMALAGLGGYVRKRRRA